MMLDRPGDIHNIKLIDFGTGLLWDHHVETIHHKNGTKSDALKIYDRKGTLNYMAPEVISA
jgi:serine/threonine protein kinase